MLFGIIAAVIGGAAALIIYSACRISGKESRREENEEKHRPERPL